MSDDDDDQVDSDANLFDGGLESPDTMGFGPLIPTESEKSLMERVRQELKHELKQVDVTGLKFIFQVCHYQQCCHISELHLFCLSLTGLQRENCGY